MSRVLVALLLGTLVVPTGALANEGSVDETRYYGTLVGTATVCRAPETVGAPAGWGGSCFALDSAWTTAAIAIEDILGPPVQGYYDFLDMAGDSLGSGTFCDTAQLDIPDGATMLRVYVDGAVDGHLVDGCGIGAAGEVRASFQ